MRRSSPIALFVAAIALGIGSANIQAAPGDITNLCNATFVDSSSKQTYNVCFNANERSDEAGVGGIFFSLYAANGRLSLSTMHGKSLAAGQTYEYDQATNSQVVTNHTPPLNLSFWEQGGAGNQAVSIGAQVLEFSAHSFVHSDAPNLVYMGPVTADIRIERKSGQIKVVMYTPRGQIKLEGHLSATPTP